MKGKLLILSFLVLLILNLPSAYSYPPESSEQESSLKYLYDRYLAIGIEYLESKKYSEAKFEFEKARFLIPQLPESYINLAIIQIHRYSYQEASQLLEQAEKLTPENYPKQYIIVYNLGLCSYHQGAFRQAAEYFSKCLELKPGLDTAISGLELSLQKMDQKPKPFVVGEESKQTLRQETKTSYSRELDRLSKSIKTASSKPSPLSATDLLSQASICFKNKQIDEALNLTQQTINLDPTNAQAHYRLGVIYASSNRFEKAINSFEAAIENDPSFLKAYINLGGAYGKLKNYSQAIKVLKKALRIDKNNAKIYYNLGMINVGMGKNRRARKYFQKAKVLAAKDGNAQLLQKIPSYKKGRFN